MVAEDFETILKGKYPAKQHVRKVVQRIRESKPDAYGIIFIEGSKTRFLEDSDLNEPFRQRRSFYYLTGCNLGNCSFIYDMQSSQSTLLIPPVDADDVVWSGLPLSIAGALQLYDIDHAHYTSETQTILKYFGAKYPDLTIFTLPIPESDIASISRFQQDTNSVLKDAIEASRIVKDEYEVAMIRKANHISSMAHLDAMKKVTQVSNESEIEAVFLARCISKGSKTLAYPLIAASGRAAATLHYEANNARLAGKQNILLDAGTEWECYASDITRTFPISGQFSAESRNIYDLVLRMQGDCIAMIKAGVNWDDVHKHAHHVAVDGLLKLGILIGESDKIFAAQTSLAFFPHGLGHYLGLDVHDTGGSANFQDNNLMMRHLRKRGVLPAGSVITVEPGIYFCKEIILPYIEDSNHRKYIDPVVLEKYWDVGGIRIEDNVLVKEDGCENLTTVIKDIKEIEDFLK